MDTTMRLYGIGTLALLLAVTQASRAGAADLVTIDSGILQGMEGAVPGIRVFLGIPYAAPPVGALRWRAPERVAPWTGVRAATSFGPRPMQKHIYSDMVFRDRGPSEDCLYLNVWTPAKAAGEKLPVMVWIYGGGFEAGATSEPRQDGTRLATKGVVVVSMNYRLGIFGFFAHPWLTAEAGGGPFGSYGIMDQAAALRWVQRNIAAFGGDPGNVTIFGESAGSYSVSLQMASPLSKGLFQKAIGESGSTVGTRRMPTERNGRVYTVAQGEGWGTLFSNSVGAKSLDDLRAMPADRLLKESQGTNYKEKGRDPAIIVDGRLFPKSPYDAFTEGSQAHVPLMAGWNADENRAGTVFAKKLTAADFEASVRKRYPNFADELLKVYPASTDAEAVRSAGDMACDGFIVASVWNGIRKHLATGGSPVYVYRFDRAVPIEPGSRVNGSPITGDQMGASHASEIPYVFGVLNVNAKAPWTPGDWALSDAIATYWSNFAKSGNPNGPGLPVWPRYGPPGESYIMHLDLQCGAQPEPASDLSRLQVWDRETPPSG
jgi:para-nitrobenzyl esterase